MFYGGVVNDMYHLGNLLRCISFCMMENAKVKADDNPDSSDTSLARARFPILYTRGFLSVLSFPFTVNNQIHALQ